MMNFIDSTDSETSLIKFHNENPMTNPTIQEQILIAEALYNSIKGKNDLQLKLSIVESNPITNHYLKTTPILSRLLTEYGERERYVLLCLIALGQGPHVFVNIDQVKQPQAVLYHLLEVLLELETFYDHIGGVIGYHLTVLKLIDSKNNACATPYYEEPRGIHLEEDLPEVRHFVRNGLKHLPEMAEIYPIGGSGDRLGLKDNDTGEPLPAAMLKFCGRNLLEGLVRDVQGREYLYYKLFGEQIVTPIAKMTSEEKNNNQRIIDLCEESGWFGRPRDSFLLFRQMLVPMLTVDGNWSMKGPGELFLKPGGHGVLWKLAQDAGVFDKFKKLGKTKLIVRQINNPVAGVDNGLLALFGFGCHHNKSFGFASCQRLVGASEGMDVLRIEKSNDGYSCSITNVEYTEFKQQNIIDSPVEEGSIYSRFPANTNVLFGDLYAIEAALEKCSVPGLLVNMKNSVDCYLGDDQYEEKKAVRLESTMQNIADYIQDHIPDRPLNLDLENFLHLKTFLTYNDRTKTLSTVKESYHPGKSLQGTPEGGFYTLMENYRDLLSQHCNILMPAIENEQDYLSSGPAFVALFHPALGPLYSVIGQKIRGGHIARGSEWVMEIAEAEVVNLELDGSLIIEADSIMGSKNSEGVIIYDSSESGKCTLINVRVRNQGVQRSGLEETWQQDVVRKESLQIILRGNAEFYAENVLLEGSLLFDVPDKKRLVVYQEGNQIKSRLEEIEGPTWSWHYRFDADDRIQLSKE